MDVRSLSILDLSAANKGVQLIMLCLNSPRLCTSTEHQDKSPDHYHSLSLTVVLSASSREEGAGQGAR